MTIINLTEQGSVRLSEIVEAIKGSISARAVAEQAGLSHTTLLKLQKRQSRAVSLATLEALAPYANRSVDELKAICQTGAHLNAVPLPLLATDMWLTTKEAQTLEQYQLVLRILQEASLSQEQLLEIAIQANQKVKESFFLSH